MAVALAVAGSLEQEHPLVIAVLQRLRPAADGRAGIRP